MAQPWERQEGESSKAFAAFCCFRDLGPKRTLIAAYTLYRGAGKGTKPAPTTPGYFKRWSALFDWIIRADAFDKHLHDDSLERLKRRREEHTIQLWETMHKSLEIQISRFDGASFDEMTRWYNSMRSSIQAFDANLDAPDTPEEVTAGPRKPTYTDPWMPKGDEPSDE